jgi:hypothetical protein
MKEATLNEVSTTITECTNCSNEVHDDYELCNECRTVFRFQVKEWLAESLFEMTGMVKIGTLTYEPARVLQCVDPIAYEEAYNDFCDMLEKDGYFVEGYSSHI